MSDQTTPTTELVHPGAEGFRERVMPKQATDAGGIHFYKCTCGGQHFRHAGYMQTMAPFMRPGGEKRIDIMDRHVMVCVKCRKAFLWINEQMYDVTERIDLEAWEKFEREAHRATGPGGDC